MELKQILCIGLLLVALIACKQEASTTEETATESIPAAVKADEGTNPNLVENMDWTFLTHQLFHHRVTVNGGKVDENDRKGDWIDFQDEGKYDYGVWGDKAYSGTWSYSDATKILELKPSGKEKPSEWRLMHKDNNLIMIGTATYGNNPLQVQWIRHEQRPDKNTKPQEEEPQ